MERFPYDPQTNALTGLSVADGIDRDDYFEIWGALFIAGLLVHIPELPDFYALKEAEEAEMTHDDETEAAEYSISVSELQLSVKSYNSLMRGGISTVGELLDRLKKIYPELAFDVSTEQVTLPEELDELIKFVEHDEKLYHDAHPGK